MSTLVEISDLRIGYKQEVELAHLKNYTLEAGKLVVLTGANGTGKTTLFKTILSEISPLSGQILIQGKNIDTISSVERALLVSVVLTRQPVYPELTVSELLRMGRLPYLGWSGKLSHTDKEKIEEIIHLLKLDALLERKLYQISDGQLQKVFLGRALIQDTPLILMDEPTSFLDWVNKHHMMDILSTVVEKTKKTILFSSHDLPVFADNVHEILAISNREILVFSPEKFNKSEILNTVFNTSFFSNEK